MELTLNAKGLIKDFGGPTRTMRRLNSAGYKITRDTIVKWQSRNSISLPALMALAVVAKNDNQRFDLHEYVEVA